MSESRGFFMGVFSGNYIVEMRLNETHLYQKAMTLRIVAEEAGIHRMKSFININRIDARRSLMHQNVIKAADV